MAVMAVADLGHGAGRSGRMAMAVVTIADLGRGAVRGRRVAMAVMTVTDLGGRRGRDLDRMTMAMVSPAHHGRRSGRRVVVVMMDAGLGRAGEGDRGGDEGDGPGVNGSDHAIS